MTTNTAARVVVVGGGLAGLTAAAYAARASRRVTVLEKATELGGRAATHEKKGFSLNIGPHALYRGGEAEHVLAELGVETKGSPPPTSSGAYALHGGLLRALPTGPVSLLTSSLLPLVGKIEVARLLARLDSLDVASLAGTSFEAFLTAKVRTPEARDVIRALIRLSTYTSDLDRLAADAALEQFKIATTRGVIYLHDGWRTLVKGLADVARAAGAEIVASAKAVSVVREDGRVKAVRLADGAEIPADMVILAASPSLASSLLPDVPALAEWAAAAIPVTAACLDVALSRLPQPRNTFALGIDQPLYFSVHSASARLAPEGGAVIHVARYGAPDDPRAGERELEEVLEMLQPGAKHLVVERRYLPSITVAHDFPQAARGGARGRPGPAVPGAPGVFVAGDWVGPVGMLADVSLASGRAAAQAATRREAKGLGEVGRKGLDARA
ncbi:phytoene desaturase family protein [Polyangium mundeleinium]|uniref:FAD-dependent oxidoreductase n=1 Tax=Polyangium mundeleinium TaxID=2995306 RepID=A0ABT5ET17_9BACT|nr:FAD-dependent oxidoreductase [Polyangium mundeleinium]MDC0744509.1 FAD-dependent oxidoreductase [Polyangium mundeleinium]